MLNNRRLIRRMFLALLCCGLGGSTLFIIWLCHSGESYFSLTRRVPAEILVVEGWIGPDSIRAAGTEFLQHNYKYVVATGGFIKNEDQAQRPTYAELAATELIDAGVSPGRLIVAPTGQIERQRTFESAVATLRALQARGIDPSYVNVFTLGPHARRTRLVYEKVDGLQTRVGVIGWLPPSYKLSPWWLSKERANCLMKEIVGYPFELLLNSGRRARSSANS